MTQPAQERFYKERAVSALKQSWEVSFASLFHLGTDFVIDKIKALEAELSALQADPQAEVRKKIDVLNDLAWASCDTDLQRAQSLSQTARTLATSINDGAEPYQLGIAYALRTLGYLNQRLGDHSLGLSQLLEAQEIFESLKHEDGLPDVFDGIAGIYYQIGNLPASLKYAYKQLEVAERMGDKRRIANAHNNLACIYFDTGDHQRSIKVLNHNLQIAAETGFKRIEALSHMNLAEEYGAAGDYDKALEHGLIALGINQEACFELFEVYSVKIIGETYLKMGNTAQALHYLEKALALCRRQDAKPFEGPILLGIGQTCRDLQQFDLAIDHLRQGLKVAQSIDAKGELYRIHLLLSEIFEQQGDFAQALHHFRQHWSVKESVFNEKADERLKVLQVVHDTETARDSQRFWQSVLDALSANIAILDEAGTIVAVNAPWRRFAEDNRLGWAEYGIGTNYLGAAEPAFGDGAEGALEAATGVRKVMAGETDQFQMEYPCHSPEEECWFAMNVTRFESNQGVRVVVAHENITARVRAEAELRKLSRAVEQSANAIIITDLDGTIEFINPALSQISGYAWDEVVGENPRIFKSGRMPPELYEGLWATVTRGHVWEGEFLNQKKGGELYWEAATISPVKDKEGKTTHYVAVKEDITARKNAEETLERQFQYEKALVACSRTLHRATEDQPFDQEILNEALGHLMESAQADRAYIFKNFDDPEDGFCSGIVAEAVRPGLPQDLNNPFYRKIPWSLVPEENRLTLEAGNPCGGPTHELFASTPRMFETLQQESIQSVQFFPIHLGDTWWGYLGFDDCHTDRGWEESEIRLLRAASEIISNVLQRWEAEAGLREANDNLARQVAQRTAELDETVVSLRQEVAERSRAEEDLRRRLAVEQGLANLSTRLMQATDLAKVVADILAETGQLIGADRLFLFRIQVGGWTTNAVNEWCAPGVEPIFGDVNGLSLEEESWLVQALRQEGGLQVENISQFPDEIQERIARFKADTGESRLVLPVYAGEEMIGFLGCHGLTRSDPKYHQDLKTLEVVVGMLGNAWQRERALAMLEQHVVARTRELSAFFDLTTLDSVEHDLPQVLEPAVTRILELGYCRAICIHLLDEDKTTLSLIAERNLPAGDEQGMREIVPHEDFTRWINQINDPVVTTDLSSFHLIPPQLRLAGFQTYLGTHLQAGGQAQGWVSYYRASARDFSLDEISILVALAEQVGVIVENHRLRQRIQEMAVSQERQRLARDLHDSVTQSLYSLTLFTRAGREAVEDGDASRLSDNLAELEATALQALREMRLLLYQLRPAALEQEGLVRALDLRFDTVERRAGIQVDYEVEGNIDLSQPVETELYHISIEALNNTLKHAGASRVSVCLCSRHDGLELKIADDGCGFDPELAHSGLGLPSMRDRVQRLGGSMEILSAPGAGTQVVVNVTDQTP